MATESLRSKFCGYRLMGQRAFYFRSYIQFLAYSDSAQYISALTESAKTDFDSKSVTESV